MVFSPYLPNPALIRNGRPGDTPWKTDPQRNRENMAQENDIVLIYFEDKPLVFARIEEIHPDVKPDWFQVKLLLLQVPLQPVTWILRTAYINGDEFTMNGKRMRLERVENPEKAETEVSDASDAETQAEKNDAAGDAKVISLTDRKKK